ncbi:phage tail tube protein [Magnetococcus sp. PR-3]|uniref:phage tail tube protein n=1 Tax=Magnetococcus sp. PR-3 TaxID=3120355 RepID=UPI002FCE0BD9
MANKKQVWKMVEVYLDGTYFGEFDDVKVTLGGPKANIMEGTNGNYNVSKSPGKLEFSVPVDGNLDVEDLRDVREISAVAHSDNGHKYTNASLVRTSDLELSEKMTLTFEGAAWEKAA